MTRLNLVPVEELYDQHLLAEWREIKMVSASLCRSLKTKSADQVLSEIPKKFTLGAGHVKFFYNKAPYLYIRFGELSEELHKRGFILNLGLILDKTGIFANLDSRFWQVYVPTEADMEIVRERIAEKVAMKPSWYRMTSNEQRRLLAYR